MIVRKLTRDWSAGYAVPNLAEEGAELELLDSSGKLVRIAWNQIKWVCYVRELTGMDGTSRDTGTGPAGAGGSNPERLLRRRFTSRPRSAGLWLRLLLADGDELEGIAANDRTLVDGPGLLLTPPDTRSNTQRVFVPRGAIRELTVLGVLHTASTRQPRTGAQPQLFENESVDSSEPALLS